MSVLLRPAIALILWAFVCVSLPGTTPAAWAADYSVNQVGNQALEQAASLVAPQRDEKIAVYRRPEAGKSRAGYGVNGDAVTILEQVSDNQSVTWNHIRFDNPPYAEGWVQETFIDLKTADTQNRGDQNAAGDGYLGNQQPQFNRHSQRQSYSQRQN
ncbi:MAG: hypothetical protein WBB01_16420 [Phormidesmis sp.]